MLVGIDRKQIYYLGDSTGTISVNEENSQSGFRPDFLIVCDYS